MDRRADYDFDLPPAQIAQVPADRRDASRLLIVGPDGALADRRFPDVVDAIPEGAIVVVNDARVIPARVHTVKESGGNCELLFVEPTSPPAAPARSGGGEREARALGGTTRDEPDPSGRPSSVTWRCLARARRPMRAGQRLQPCKPGHRGEWRAEAPTLVVTGERADDTTVEVEVPGDVHAFLDTWGELPLPPYIGRAGGDTAADRERYQTVYASVPGAVAAPTAGLHLTPEILAALEARGATIARVTLHVGLGTFAPIRVDALAEHVMHRERYDVPAATAALVATGRPVVAVGTTVVRTLEAAATGARSVAVGPGETRLFLRPGAARFQVVDHLITNFHLPESTLLMLVCAFAGTAPVLAAYRHAVAAGYRFFSYGDAMYLTRGPR